VKGICSWKTLEESSSEVCSSSLFVASSRCGGVTTCSLPLYFLFIASKLSHDSDSSLSKFHPHPVLTTPPSGLMPLHLLHHKSWHVYNKDNVERVRRDKAKAQKKEDEDEMRMNIADQERRLAQLRGNVPTEGPAQTHPEETTSERKKDVNRVKHVNLFEDVEKGQRAPVETNPEREIELAKEKKKWEDMVTSRLINATTEHAPWYSQLDKTSGVEREKSDVERELAAQKQSKWKEEADPLKVMNRFLERKREVEEREGERARKMNERVTKRERRRREPTPEYSPQEERKRSRSRSPRRTSHKKHRHRHHHSPDIEKLREETRLREQAERDRVKKLLRQDQEEPQDRYRAVGHYSAQFHPEAVRR
jgi:hypothetical protein